MSRLFTMELPITNSTLITPLRDETMLYLNSARSEATQLAYRNDWRVFTRFCSEHLLVPLPAEPQTISVFLTSSIQSGKKNSTVSRYITSISMAHKTSGYDSPCNNQLVRDTMKGILRTHKNELSQATPLLPSDLNLIVESLPDTITGLRDKAIILLGFAGAFRRSELVGLMVEDLRFCEDGIKLTLRRCKEDQAGVGVLRGIPFSPESRLCPVKAVNEWMTAAKIRHGPLFRRICRYGYVGLSPLNDKSICRIVHDRAESANISSTKISGHSLRAGFITAAAKAGKSVFSIMRQTGHKKMDTVNRYVREATLFSENAASGLFSIKESDR